MADKPEMKTRESASSTPLASNAFLHLIDEVVRLHGRLQTLFSDFYEQTGLTRLEQMVLTSVLDSERSPTVSQIGRSLGFARQVIQRAANSLVAAGLIEKAANPDHKRAPLLVPTSRGRELKEKSDQLALAIATRFLGGTEEGKYHRVAGDVKNLRRKIEAYLRQGKAN